ncbi:MAG: hypothetical protein Q9165_007579 [Trypethelium subeluteriae]
MSLSSEVLEENQIAQSLGPDFATIVTWSWEKYLVTDRPLMDTVQLNVNEDSIQTSDLPYDDRAAYLDEIVAHGGHVGDLESARPPKEAVVIIPLAILACIQFVASRATVENLELEDKAAIRGALRWQLNELDAYLHKIYMADGVDTSIDQMIDAIRLDVLESQMSTDTARDHIPSGSSETTGPPELPKVPVRIPVGQSMQKAVQYFDTDSDDEFLIYVQERLGVSTAKWGSDHHLARIYDVIVFRAIVMAAFLAMVADVSQVVGTEVGKRVVYFV